ncbi:MAG: hypothetical protein PVI07_07170 [Anaerolineae bacterium]|jgi:hypothetical protein
MRQWVRVPIRPLLLGGLVLGVTLAALWAADATGWASPAGGEATIFPPNRVGGASGHGDARDADVYPAVAYDPSTGQYLTVWLSARNADSASDGFDVYGVFLDSSGQPAGSEFRISDDNTAARNGLPTIAAGDGEFAVAWTAKGDPCRVFVQRVTDASPRADHLLVSGTGHHHSPSLAYNRARQHYALTYVAGDDYLPPTLFGADTADCGNNASSTSNIRANEFYFSGDSPVTGTPLDVSAVNGGAFRPHVAYSSGLSQYLVAWEDRRSAGGEAYRLDVYAQRLSSDMALAGSDIALAAGGYYTNYDTSATWTPRPAVAGGGDRFLVTWCSREAKDSALIWSVEGNLISSGGTPGTVFTVAQMSFAQLHAGQSPTGFLSAAYASTVQEYMVGMTSHLESVWGYLSSARIQRISNNGQLLRMDGSVQSAPGVGYAVDYANEDQIALGLAVNPASGADSADHMAVYARHRTDQPPQDIDIWSVRGQVPHPYSVYLPLVCRGG